ncbi:hypothetical protein SLS53_006836 [Cytospora paraplurivora]|uniref:Uncharacterized protein n=1 Tax=Cytospora paraplurivora TaxID=2898453 RepID=A0AAN9YEK7_9PEZI
MPRRYRPAATVQPATATRPDVHPSIIYKAARRSSISALLGYSSREGPAGKHRRKGSDDDYDKEDDELDASLPRKKLKSVDKSVLEAVDLDDIQDLERVKAYLNDALCYINQLGDALARPDAVAPLAGKISWDMSDESEGLCDEIYNLGYSKTWTTSDNVSKSMEKFLPDIEELMTIPNPDTLRLAYELVIQLSRDSFGDLDVSESCGFGDRPSDEPADLLLRRLIRKRLAAGETWNWKRDLKVLDDTCKHVGAYGIEPWYPKSRRALRELVSKKAGTRR